MLEAGFIPPNLHYDVPNPKIDFHGWRLDVPTKLTAWPGSGVRRISINSFGYAGTNAHAVLDDARSYLAGRGVVEMDNDFTDHQAALNDKTNLRKTDNSQQLKLYVLSAQDKDGLKRVKASLASHLSDGIGRDLKSVEQQQSYAAQLAFTLGQYRSHLKWRTYAFASSCKDLVDELRSEESTAAVTQTSSEPRLGFVFTGQGAQWPRMGVELMAFPVFRDAVRASDVYLQEVCACSWSTTKELSRSKSTSQLHLAEFSQTLCAVLQVALIDLLRSWGIRPTAVVGHSSGEIGAAYALGALSREDAWRVAYYRGVLSAGIKAIAPDIDGCMMAVGLSPEKAQSWISTVTEGDVVIACINSPTSVTVSGDTSGIDQLLQKLKQAGIFARKLMVDTAYHSPHMHTIAQEYYDWIADLQPLDATDKCRMHSSVTGTEVAPHQLGVVNWVRNLTSPVRFSEAVYDMLRPLHNGRRTESNAVDMLVEIGPHSALQGPVMQTLTAHNVMNIPYQSAVVRNQDAVGSIMHLAGALWSRGYQVDLRAVNELSERHSTRPLIDLPTYPWKHSQRYYHDVRVEQEYLHKSMPKLSLIGAPLQSMRPREYSWRRVIRLAEEPWIADHKIQGSILYPGAGYLAMALEAANQTADKTKKIASYRLRDIQLTAAAIISEDQDLECIIQLRPHIVGTRDSASTWTEFAVTSSPDGKSLITNCSGLLVVEYDEVAGSEAALEKSLELAQLRCEFDDIEASCSHEVDAAKMYEEMTMVGLQYGPAFANVCNVSNGEGTAHGVVRVPDLSHRVLDGHDRPHVIHPGTLDAIFHLAFASTISSNALVPMVPKFIAEISVSACIPWQQGTRLSGASKTQRHGLRDLMADIIVLGGEGSGDPAIHIQGLQLTEVVGGSSGPSSNDSVKSMASNWVWKPAIDFLTLEDLPSVLKGETATEILDEVSQQQQHVTKVFTNHNR